MTENERASDMTDFGKCSEFVRDGKINNFKVEVYRAYEAQEKAQVRLEWSCIINGVEFSASIDTIGSDADSTFALLMTDAFETIQRELLGLPMAAVEMHGQAETDPLQAKASAPASSPEGHDILTQAQCGILGFLFFGDKTFDQIALSGGGSRIGEARVVLASNLRDMQAKGLVTVVGETSALTWAGYRIVTGTPPGEHSPRSDAEKSVGVMSAWVKYLDARAELIHSWVAEGLNNNDMCGRLTPDPVHIGSIASIAMQEIKKRPRRSS